MSGLPMWVVTGVPRGAQEKAALAGRDRRARTAHGAKDNVKKHRVRGQEVYAFAVDGAEGARLMQQCVEALVAKGLIVTRRRWRPR